MKRILRRISITLFAMGIGAAIFYLLLMSGEKGKGPLEELASRIGRNVARLEKKWTGTDIRESRSDQLAWLTKYRNSKVLLNTADTIFTGIYDDSTYNTYEPVVELEQKLGHTFPILHFYTAWGSKKDQAFPNLRAQAIYDLGSIPMITWEPWLDDFNPGDYNVPANRKNKNEGGLKLIAAGVFDAYIDNWAKDAKSFRQPVMVRLAHEMNDPYRYPWGPQNNAPEDFVAAWQHVVRRFNQAGAHNVIWIWSPHPAYAGYMDYYPGEAYADWLGVTVLNYGTAAPWSQWWSFDDTFAKAYHELEGLQKPIMITELGSLDVGGNRAQWYRDALDSLPVKYPRVKSFLLFHVGADNTTTYKTLDWSIRQDSSTIAAIKKSMALW